MCLFSQITDILRWNDTFSDNLLFIGGYNDDEDEMTFSKNATAFDPTERRFRQLACTTHYNLSCAAACSQRDVIVCGGSMDNQAQASCELYRSENNR